MFKEIVRGVSTGTTAFVADWDSDDRILKVTNVGEVDLQLVNQLLVLELLY